MVINARVAPGRQWAAQVERVCAASTLQLTALRRLVIAIIARAPAPLGAYAIIEELARAQRKPVAPPTVYRTLDFLLAHGFLHRIESRNLYARCAHPGHPHDGMLLVCGNCGMTNEIDDPRLNMLLRKSAGVSGFLPDRQLVEVEGVCGPCGSQEGVQRRKR